MPTTATLSNVHICAIASAFSAGAVTAAKRSLPDETTHAVDHTFRFRGHVNKGAGTADIEVETVPSVTLFNAGVVTELLKRLKLEPAKLRRMLRSIADTHGAGETLATNEPNAALLAEFRKVGDEHAATMPKQTSTLKGRAGSVSAKVEVEIV